jgi:hypothetical protein
VIEVQVQEAEEDEFDEMAQQYRGAAFLDKNRSAVEDFGPTVEHRQME